MTTKPDEVSNPGADVPLPAGWAIRRAEDRGRTRIGWLDSRHSFSFGRYADPNHNGYRSLRVINDDRIAGGSGFGEHGHRDMEILTWVLDGALLHGDSLGQDARRLEVGELQAMTAGSGIRHSEMNALQDGVTRLLQIWIEPRTRGLEPSYRQRTFPQEGRRGRWQTLANPDGSDGAMQIQQDASLLVVNLSEADPALSYELTPGRYAYLHVALGSLSVNGVQLDEGDALKIPGQARLAVSTGDSAQALLFDLA